MKRAGRPSAVVSERMRDHHEAMSCLDDASRARTNGDAAGVAKALRRALELEEAAARTCLLTEQPTRSVLYRSATAIAALLDDAAEARRLALEGLRGACPAEIKVEIYETLDEIDRRKTTRG